MSELTNADKESFAQTVSTTLTENATEFAGLDFTPATRTAAIAAGQTDLTKKIGLRKKAEADLRTAVDVENASRDALYKTASQAVGGAVNALPVGHKLTDVLHKLRPEMHHDGGKQPAKPA